MISTATLTGTHLRTYNTLFQHPVSHNLAWHDVHSLLRHLGRLDEEPNGNLKATRNGESLVLHVPLTKDVAETEELMALRHFIERSETATAGMDQNAAQWLLVIDHHEAHVFRSEMHGAVPQQLLPQMPDGYFRHAQNSQNLSRGKEKPEPNTFFEPVAKALHGAGQLLIFGVGTGKSCEMEQFVVWLNVHHPDLADRIIGTVVVDEHHLTESQLLAKAREFYATPRKPVRI